MRRQRPRGTTTRDDVLSAALAVIDTVGIERVTIRSVAKVAGTPPMSLYTHFSNKNQLLDLVYSELARRLYVDDRPATTWQNDLLGLSRHARSILIEHPRWIPLLARPAIPFVVPIRERLLKLMVDDGLSPVAALRALTSVMMATVGLVLVEVTLRDPDGQAAFTKRYDRVRASEEADTSDETPITRRAFTKLGRLNLEESFLHVMRSMIAGMDLSRTANEDEDEGAFAETPEHSVRRAR